MGRRSFAKTCGLATEEGAGGLEAFVITGQAPKVELATRDILFLDRGKDAGVAVGDVFRLYDGKDGATWGGWLGVANVHVPVGTAVVVRVLPGSATAFVTSSNQSFPAGAVAWRGSEGSR